MTQQDLHIEQSFNVGDIVRLTPDIAQYLHLDPNNQYKVNKVWRSNLENSRFNSIIGQAMYGLNAIIVDHKNDVAEFILRDFSKFPICIYDDHLIKVEDGESLWAKPDENQTVTDEQSKTAVSTNDAAPDQSTSKQSKQK